MQILNFFNARKLNDEFNIFAGICNNQLFTLIVFFIIAIEVNFIFNSILNKIGNFNIFWRKSILMLLMGNFNIL